MCGNGGSRAGQGERCEVADWLVYGAKMYVSSSLLEALKTYYKNIKTPLTTTTTAAASDYPAVSPIFYRYGWIAS